MRVLLTGASGLLGSYLLKTAPGGMEIYFGRFNILSQDDSHLVMLRTRPEIIIHCAGDGRVDHAEQHYSDSWLSNVFGLANVLAEAMPFKPHLVVLSSNAVYVGWGEPNRESSARAPANRYGQIKLSMELLGESWPGKLSIIRPILLYGWPQAGKRGNMATRIIDGLQQEGIQIPIATDIISQPTYAWDCAAAIWDILRLQTLRAESWNVAPQERMTLHQFACHVAQEFGGNAERILACKNAVLNLPAPRPHDTTFDTTKIRSYGIKLRDPIEGLRAMKAEAR